MSFPSIVFLFPFRSCLVAPPVIFFPSFLTDCWNPEICCNFRWNVETCGFSLLFPWFCPCFLFLLCLHVCSVLFLAFSVFFFLNSDFFLQFLLIPLSFPFHVPFFSQFSIIVPSVVLGYSFHFSNRPSCKQASKQANKQKTSTWQTMANRRINLSFGDALYSHISHNIPPIYDDFR